MITMIDV